MTLRAQRGTPRHPLPRTSPRPRTARACPHRTRWPSPRSAAPHGSRGGRKAPGQPRRPPPSTNGSVWPLLRWARSEERRVGEEGRSRWAPYYLKKKNKNNESSGLLSSACGPDVAVGVEYSRQHSGYRYILLYSNAAYDLRPSSARCLAIAGTESFV